MRKWGFLLLALSAVSVANAQVYTTKHGKLEFAGLKRWTPERIMKELGYKSFDDMHACAALLKQKLGFAEAAVVGTFMEDKKLHYLVTVVEPEDKARVSRTSPYLSVVTPDEWYPITKSVTADFMDLVQGMSFSAADQPMELPPIYKDLKKLNRPVDLDAALRAAVSDRDPTDRMVATAVLSNFPQEDRAWYALMAAVRDESDFVCGLAYDALRVFAKKHPRKVDWTPAVKDIRYILNGTSLFGAASVLRALIASEVSPELAKDLVGNGGGQILIPFLKVSRPDERDLALKLLRRLSGKDYGLDADKWQEWLDSLK